MKEILSILKNVELRNYESIDDKNKFLKKVKNLPSDYLDFISTYNGGVGFVGDNRKYIDLWNVENLINLNPYYPNEEFSEQSLIIGTDGSGTLYGYNFLEKVFFETDQYEMSITTSTKAGYTFVEFLIYLQNK